MQAVAVAAGARARRRGEPPPREDGSAAEEEAPPALAADAEDERSRFLRTYGQRRAASRLADHSTAMRPTRDKAHRFSTIAGGFERALDGLHEGGGDLGAVLDELSPQERARRRRARICGSMIRAFT